MFALLAGTGKATDKSIPLDLLPPNDLPAAAAAAKGPSDQPAVEVIGGPAPSTTTILIVSEPSISSPHYAVRGKVKYEGVAGDGYLELWNDFESAGKYFTRSLAPWGQMKKLSGSSGWRSFELPFYAERGMRPKQLTLNVVLPGAGKVTVSQTTLVDLSSTGAWWTEPQAGLWGGLLGSFVGILGGLVGWLSSRGKSPSLTKGLYSLGLTIGSVSLTAGLVAVCIGQPWHVTYPLLLCGIIAVFVFGANFRQFLQRRRNDELRRIAAVDA
jgi:hypothetical protein